MAKRKNTKEKKTSKGERKSSISTRINSPSAKVINQLKAHNAGKRVMVTIANPNKEETNKLFIRVPSTTVWGNPKDTNRFIMR